jgi:glycosyltransferase involved in cell wall biosynthesis
MRQPFLSLITSTLNCAHELELTCDSIRLQNIACLEWIIADGASIDGTLLVIQKNADLISTWFSEADSGIYSAWNKAIKHARGEWVIFFGAGDIFPSAKTVKKIEHALRAMPDNVGLVYGNVQQQLDNGLTYYFEEVNLTDWDEYRPKLPCHQGVIVRRHLFSGDRPFDPTYRIVADSKFLLSVLKHCDVRYMDIDVCHMHAGGVSSSPRSAVRVAREFLRLETDIGYQIPWRRKLRFLSRAYVKYYLWAIFGQRFFDKIHLTVSKAKSIR